jgi:hypothetical protein
MIEIVGCKSDIINVLKSDYKWDKISIIGSLSLDSVIIYVSKSTDTYSEVTEAELEVQQAKVYIEDEGTFHYDLVSADGKHFQAQILGLKIGRKYKIFASANNLPSVETDWIIIPEITIIEDLNVIKTNGSYRSPNQISFSFEDKIGANYYYLDIVLKKANLIGNVASSPPSFTESACYDIFAFSDMCFEGKKAILQYTSYSETIFPRTKGYQVADFIIIRFGGVSEQVYKEKLASNSGYDLISSINEPPLTYTNVKNGYGVVFAHNLKDYVLPVPK